ncbi:MAG: DUF4130 domain-containing protein [Acidobacteriota bacterium]|nr:DUF4130 domain-containing protein [Acidobacteriota bacterium]
MIAVSAQDFESWRILARKLLSAGVLPNELHWSGSSPSLFEGTNPPLQDGTITVPKGFMELAKIIALHRREDRWAQLYRVLYRTTHGERDLLKVDVDDDVRTLRLMEKAVRRDMHKMTASSGSEKWQELSRSSSLRGISPIT